MVQASVSEASLAGDFARPHFISSETTQSVLAWPEVIQILLLFLLTFVPYRLYNTHSVMGGVSEYARVFNACTSAMMLVVIATFVLPEFIVSRMWVMCSWALSLPHL